MMTTFVLVHGTGCGGWVWKKMTPLLRERGHEVFTPTLSGVGDRAHLLGNGIDLTTHILDVANLMEYEDLTESRVRNAIRDTRSVPAGALRLYFFSA